MLEFDRLDDVASERGATQRALVVRKSLLVEFLLGLGVGCRLGRLEAGVANFETLDVCADNLARGTETLSFDLGSEQFRFLYHAELGVNFDELVGALAALWGADAVSDNLLK